MLHECWRRGIEIFLYFGELTAHRVVGSLLTDGDRKFIRVNKPYIIEEIRSISAAPRISGENFYGPGLMADAAYRRNNHE